MTNVDAESRPNAPWHQSAACVGHDPEWWSAESPMRAAGALICLQCPVRQPCLTEAMDAGDLGVVRGGMLLDRVASRYQTIDLTCPRCRALPIRMTGPNLSRFCGGERCHGRQPHARRRASRHSASL